MPRKEFIHLMESNIRLLDKLAGRLHRGPMPSTGFPRQQMTVLVRLFMGGRARLKDIARREGVTTPNLCATFRKLEHDGLILRTIDDNDRRNTWYAVTARGEELAKQAMENFCTAIESMFADLSRDDEEKLCSSLKTINGVLEKMEKSNA